MIVGARLFFDDNSYNFQKVLKDAVSTFGIPNKLYCDHGPSYENSQLSFICGSIGTVLLHAPVRDGAAKAKIERTFGTLKSRWLNGLDTKQILSIDEFNLELTEAVRKHNLTVNSSTEQAPMDRFLPRWDAFVFPSRKNGCTNACGGPASISCRACFQTVAFLLSLSVLLTSGHAASKKRTTPQSLLRGSSFP